MIKVGETGDKIVCAVRGAGPGGWISLKFPTGPMLACPSPTARGIFRVCRLVLQRPMVLVIVSGDAGARSGGCCCRRWIGETKVPPVIG